MKRSAHGPCLFHHTTASGEIEARAGGENTGCCGGRRRATAASATAGRRRRCDLTSCARASVLFSDCFYFFWLSFIRDTAKSAADVLWACFPLLLFFLPHAQARRRRRRRRRLDLGLRRRPWQRREGAAAFSAPSREASPSKRRHRRTSPARRRHPRKGQVGRAGSQGKGATAWPGGLLLFSRVISSSCPFRSACARLSHGPTRWPGRHLCPGHAQAEESLYVELVMRPAAPVGNAGAATLTWCPYRALALVLSLHGCKRRRRSSKGASTSQRQASKIVSISSVRSSRRLTFGVRRSLRFSAKSPSRKRSVLVFLSFHPHLNFAPFLSRPLFLA